MNRRRLGWPPNSAANRATDRARGIERALAKANRPAPRRCQAKADEPRTLNGGCLNCGALAGEACREKRENDQQQ